MALILVNSSRLSSPRLKQGAKTGGVTTICFLQIRVIGQGRAREMRRCLRHRCGGKRRGYDHETAPPERESGPGGLSFHIVNTPKAECQQVRQDRHQARRKQFVETSTQGGDAGERATGWRVVERDVSPLQRGHQLPARSKHALCDVMHDVHLRRNSNRDKNRRSEIQQRTCGSSQGLVGGG